MPKLVSERLTELNEQITRLVAERDHLAGLTPEQRLATDLHEFACTAHHDAGPCGFQQSTHLGWDGGSRPDYLRRARALLSAADGDESIAYLSFHAALGIVRAL